VVASGKEGAGKSSVQYAKDGGASPIGQTSIVKDNVLEVLVERFERIPDAEVGLGMCVLHLNSSNAMCLRDARLQSRGQLPLEGFFCFEAEASTDRYSSRVQLQVKATVPKITFTLSPIANLPLVRTPLGERLLKRERKSNMGYGLLTLDKTRRAVPLLENDPAVGKMCLVGVWIDMTGAETAQQNEPAQGADGAGGSSSGTLTFPRVDHPAIWMACTRFLSTECLGERVFVAPKTFLVMLVTPNSSVATTQGNGGLSKPGASLNLGSAGGIEGHNEGHSMRFFEVSFCASTPVQAASSGILDLSRCKNHIFEGDVELDYDTNVRHKVTLNLNAESAINDGGLLSDNSPIAAGRSPVYGKSATEIINKINNANASLNISLNGSLNASMVHSPKTLLNTSCNTLGAASVTTQVLWPGGKYVPPPTLSSGGVTNQNVAASVDKLAKSPVIDKIADQYANQQKKKSSVTDKITNMPSALAMSNTHPIVPPSSTSNSGLPLSSAQLAQLSPEVWLFLEQQQKQLSALQQQVSDLTRALTDQQRDKQKVDQNGNVRESAAQNLPGNHPSLFVPSIYSAGPNSGPPEGVGHSTEKPLDTSNHRLKSSHKSSKSSHKSGSSQKETPGSDHASPRGRAKDSPKKGAQKHPSPRMKAPDRIHGYHHHHAAVKHHGSDGGYCGDRDDSMAVAIPVQSPPPSALEVSHVTPIPHSSEWKRYDINNELGPPASPPAIIAEEGSSVMASTIQENNNSHTNKLSTSENLTIAAANSGVDADGELDPIVNLKKSAGPHHLSVQPDADDHASDLQSSIAPSDAGPPMPPPIFSLNVAPPSDRPDFVDWTRPAQLNDHTILNAALAERLAMEPSDGGSITDSEFDGSVYNIHDGYESSIHSRSVGESMFGARSRDGSMIENNNASIVGDPLGRNSSYGRKSGRRLQTSQGGGAQHTSQTYLSASAMTPMTPLMMSPTSSVGFSVRNMNTRDLNLHISSAMNSNVNSAANSINAHNATREIKTALGNSKTRSPNTGGPAARTLVEHRLKSTSKDRDSGNTVATTLSLAPQLPQAEVGATMTISKRVSYEGLEDPPAKSSEGMAPAATQRSSNRQLSRGFSSQDSQPHLLEDLLEDLEKNDHTDDVGNTSNDDDEFDPIQDANGNFIPAAVHGTLKIRNTIQAAAAKSAYSLTNAKRGGRGGKAQRRGATTGDDATIVANTDGQRPSANNDSMAATDDSPFSSTGANNYLIRQKLSGGGILKADGIQRLSSGGGILKATSGFSAAPERTITAEKPNTPTFSSQLSGGDPRGAANAIPQSGQQHALGGQPSTTRLTGTNVNIPRIQYDLDNSNDSDSDDDILDMTKTSAASSPKLSATSEKDEYKRNWGRAEQVTSARRQMNNESFTSNLSVNSAVMNSAINSSISASGGLNSAAKSSMKSSAGGGSRQNGVEQTGSFTGGLRTVELESGVFESDEDDEDVQKILQKYAGKK